MFQVTREIDFCYGHRLLNYQGKCRYLHGHNGRAVITIESDTLDERGMVLDFGVIKADVSGWIDENTWEIEQVGRANQGLLFRVRARDEFGNMTEWSDWEAAIPRDQDTGDDDNDDDDDDNN